jgi:sugar phosphate isomerase/epimerase
MKSTLSRRNFLRTGAIAAAAFPALKTLPASADTAFAGGYAPVNLGLASYSFRSFNRAQLIDFMKQLNLSALNAKNVKDHLPADPAEEAKALAEYAAAGIKLHAAGTIDLNKNDEADMRSKFEYCKRAGIAVMVAAGPTAETLPLIEKLAGEYDIRVAIHNHGPEDKLWPSPLDVLKVVGSMDPRIGCCIDLGHAARAGADVVKAIHEVGPRLFNIHIKDLKSFQDRGSQVAVGEGIMPIPKIFEALVAIRYKGFVDLEYEINAENPMPGVISSFAYMRGVLAGMSAV